MTRKFALDALERLAWTGAEAAIAQAAVVARDLPPAWVVPIGMAIAAIKAIVARHVGNPDSAATLKA